ncbi:MAG: tetratricopeptide repeat protein [Bacteroidota bacterium]
MEITEELQDKIDRYVLEQMDVDERAAFDALMSQQQELYREVALQQELIGTLERAGDYKLKLKLDKVYDEVMEPKKSVKPLHKLSVSWKIWAVAASFLLVLTFILLRLNNTPVDNQQLFTQYYHPEKYIAVRSATTEANKAGDYFNNGAYAKALDIFNSRIRTNPNSYYDLLYAGVCYLELGKYSLAEKNFQRVIRESDLLRDRGQWYLALVYLKSNQLERCKISLQSIIANPTVGTYRKLAEDLSAKL